MGVLRILLALAVLIAHSGPIFGIQSVGGDVAVEAFFLISGFYMSLVLNNGKYSKGSYLTFITNRLLKLFPVYWVVAGLTLLVSAVTWGALGAPLKLAAFQQVEHLSFGAWALLIWSNVFILGQDIIMFLGLDKQGGLHFTSDFMASSPPLYTFLLVHICWSLAVEIVFYLIAPFILRRKPAILIALCAASLLIRFLLYQKRLYRDPFSYRFFPSELVFFLVGALGYRAYVALQVDKLPKALLQAAFGLVLAYTIFYQFVPGGELVRQVGYYVCFALALPLIFALTKQSRWQIVVGNLSYPVYVSHLLVLILLPPVLTRLHLSQEYLPYFLVFGTLIAATLLERFIVEPVEVFRQRRVTVMKEKARELSPVS